MGQAMSRGQAPKLLEYLGSYRLSSSGLAQVRSHMGPVSGKADLRRDGLGRWLFNPTAPIGAPWPEQLTNLFGLQDESFRRLSPQIMNRLAAARASRALLAPRERMSLWGSVRVRLIGEGKALTCHVHSASLVLEHTDASGVFRATSWCDPSTSHTEVRQLLAETDRPGELCLAQHWRRLLAAELMPEIEQLVIAPFAWEFETES